VDYADGRPAVVPVAKADIVNVNTLREGETLGLRVDPVHKKLVPIEAPMARLVCTPIDAGVSRGYRRRTSL